MCVYRVICSSYQHRIQCSARRSKRFLLITDTFIRKYQRIFLNGVRISSVLTLKRHTPSPFQSIYVTFINYAAKLQKKFRALVKVIYGNNTRFCEHYVTHMNTLYSSLLKQVANKIKWVISGFPLKSKSDLRSSVRLPGVDW